MNTGKLRLDVLLSTLPEERDGNHESEIKSLLPNRVDAIIVLDDDPTGTQTVHSVPVLTQWDEQTISSELENDTPLFFILTNSRSLDADQADRLAYTIGQNIGKVSKRKQKKCWVVSRGDSTLRGHYPGEVIALTEGLKISNFVQFLIPAFFEGGRYTANNIHYMLQEHELIPVAQTPFAEDKVFGYKHSDLRLWIKEKTKYNVPAKEVETISLKELRAVTEQDLIQKINNFQQRSTCVVNAMNYGDLQLFLLAVLKSKVNPVFRTSASFVATLNPVPKKELLQASELSSGTGGGLIVVGSYVPTTSTQLDHMLKHVNGLVPLELNVADILNSADTSPGSISDRIDQYIQKGKTVVLFTSREIIQGDSDEQNQQIEQKISAFVAQTIYKIKVKPSYILTKGGITSSDIATRSLGVKRAIAQGQVLDGVPVWKLGAETKFPGLPLIIFPGNVGPVDGVTQVVNKLNIN